MLVFLNVQFVLQFTPSPYLETMFVYFKERVSLCSPGWPLPFNAPASGPLNARIRDMCHHTWLDLYYMLINVFRLLSIRERNSWSSLWNIIVVVMGVSSSFFKEIKYTQHIFSPLSHCCRLQLPVPLGDSGMI